MIFSSEESGGGGERAWKNVDFIFFELLISNLSNSVIVNAILCFISVSPIVIVSNQLIASYLGSNAVLECQTESNPMAETFWILNDHSITQGSKHTIRTTTNSYRTYSKLVIKNVTKSDFGMYRCSSKNSLGETEGTIRLYGEQLSKYLVLWHRNRLNYLSIFLNLYQQNS